MWNSEEFNRICEIERKKTNRNGLIAVLLAAVIITMFFLGYFVREITEPNSGQKLNEIIKIIEDKSVWATEMSADDLAEQLVNKLLVDDKYAKYYSPSEYKRVQKEDSGAYSGVGVAFDALGTVAQVNMNSPAYKSGVNVGDKIVAGVYKKDVQTDEESDKIFTNFSEKLLEEQEENEEKTIFDIYGEFFADFELGEEFDVEIRRGDKIIELTLKKENYTVAYVEYYDSESYFYFSTEKETVKEQGKDVEKDVFGARVEIGRGNPELSVDTAYIRLCAFEGTAATQFNGALDYMKQQGRTKLIIDLRGNGGGLIGVLTEIASYLVYDNGKPQIKVLKVKEKLSETHYSTSGDNFYDNITDISVIANCGTASASEALIGALNDYGDSVEYGGANFSLNNLVLTGYNAERKTYCTYGKGIMQTTYGLKSGGALMLTTAYIYWPVSKDESGKPICIQDVGITTPVEENCVSDENAIKRANEILHTVIEETQD